jgi:hypothetical protein
MPFEKGKSGNPEGRTKGSINVKTKVWNEIGEWFANEGLEAYKNNLMDLMTNEDDKIKSEAMKRYEALLEYFRPKLSRSEVKSEVTESIKIDFTD